MDNGRVLLLGSGESARALAGAGFLMRQVSEQADALVLAAQEPFDVLVIDLDMPKVDSVSLIRRLRETSSAASVVWLASHHSNELAARATEIGVLQVLSKPAKADALRRVVAAGVSQTRNLLSTLRAVMQPPVLPRSVPATEAKNEFGAILDAAVQSGAVFITKHDAPRAVLVSVERLRQLMARHEPDLGALARELDETVARMRTPEARAAARGLFTAAPQAFGAAALAGARKPRG